MGCKYLGIKPLRRNPFEKITSSVFCGILVGRERRTEWLRFLTSTFDRKKLPPLWFDQGFVQQDFRWVFPRIGISQDGQFIMEHPIMDDLGVPLFLEIPR